MAIVTQCIYPFSDVCLITKNSKYSTVVAVTKMLGRVVIFDALSGITYGKTYILYVSKELDKAALDKKFIAMIGKMVVDDVGSKYFLADRESFPFDHCSNGSGAKDLTATEIKQIEEKVDIILTNNSVDEAITELLKPVGGIR